MAVYIDLSEDQARLVCAMYEGCGDYVSHEGVAEGSINSVFRVVTDEGTFYLRVHEGRALSDLAYEKNLLFHLHARAPRLGDVVVPRLLKNAAQGFFFPLDEQRYCMLFEELPGRDLAVFEVGPDHVAQLGAFMARAHRALLTFVPRRPNPYGADVVRGWFAAFAAAGFDPALTARLRRDFDAIDEERRAMDVPTGVIHGDAFINNTKWSRGRLAAVFDWEMAGDDHLIYDLAVTLNAWAWRPTAHEFDPGLCQALIAAYEAVRPLAPAERAGLWAETRYAALRFCLSRIRDFELKDASGPRAYLDHRDYLRRLDALLEWTTFVADVTTPRGKEPA